MLSMGAIQSCLSGLRPKKCEIASILPPNATCTDKMVDLSELACARKLKDQGIEIKEVYDFIVSIDIKRRLIDWSKHGHC